MDRKDKVIHLLEQAWDLEEQFLNEQPLDERERPGTLENWARKDVAAHIETWDGRLANNIRMARRGDIPQRNPDFDSENKIIFENNQSRTWQEVYDFARQGRQELVKVVEELGCEGLDCTDVLPWSNGQPIWQNIVGNGFTHAIIHIAEHYRGLGQPELYAKLIERLATDTVDLDDSPTWQGGILYNTACAHALNGQTDRAMEELGRALKMRPDLRDWSREDSDLVSLRGEPGYEELYQ